MRPPPYVGISGVGTPEQARALLDAWPANAPPQSLMLGLLASRKTMTGGERNSRSPAPEEIAAIFNVCDRRALCLVHYYTKDPTTLCEQLIRVHTAGGDRCDGVQINVPWPPVEQLQEFTQWAPRATRVVLQVGPRALADIGYDPYLLSLSLDVTHRLKAYRGIVTDVLIDPSGGRGRAVDRSLVRALGWDICYSLPDAGITIAGGLCADTLPSVASMVRAYDLSMDAEGRLRDDHDQLDLDKALAWLQAAAPLVGSTGGDDQ